MAPLTAQQQMRCIGLDLFKAAGKNWLVIVDRYSGYAWKLELRSTTTKHVLKVLDIWLSTDGRHTFERTMDHDLGPSLLFSAL